MNAIDACRTAIPLGGRTRARALLGWPFYPMILAIYFPVHLMADNLALFPVAQVVRPVLASFAVAVIALLLLRVIGRSWHRAALWVASGFVLVWLFAPIQEFFDSATRTILGNDYPGRYLLVGLLVLSGAVGFLMRSGRTLTMFANIVAAVMLLIPLLTIGYTKLAVSYEAAAAGVEAQYHALSSALIPAEEKPSIIHIVLDMYSRQDVLEETFGFDNSPFLHTLRERGFAVADRATTPYGQTLLVMSSILSARFVQEMVPDRPSDGDLFRQILIRRLRNNDVIRTLADLGYQIAATDVEYDPVRLKADRVFDNRTFRLTNFEKAAFERTAIGRVLPLPEGLSGDFVRETFERSHHRDLKAPFFLYVHALAPHGPFDVDRHGNPVAVDQYGTRRRSRGEKWAHAYKEWYTDKLRFVNDLILPYVDRVLAEVPDPKIVIIHGDHGSKLYFRHEASTSCLKERFTTLLAIYSSDGRLQRALTEDFNLVNLYRVIFNEYFHADLPLLPNRSFHTTWSRPDQLVPVSPADLRRPCLGGATP